MALSLRCRRYMVLSYSVFLAVCGIALMVIGSGLIYIYVNHYGLGLQNKGWGPMAGLIAIGFVSLPISWLGWRAADKRKIWIIAGFIFLLSCIVIGLVTICIMSLVQRESVPVEFSTIENSFALSLKGESPHDKYWEKVQNELECCGVNGPVDYRSSNGIPWACCSTQGNAFNGPCNAVFQRGCLDVLVDDVRKILAYTSLIALIFGVVLSMGLFCSGHLAKKLRQLAQVPQVAYKAPTNITVQQAKALLNGSAIPAAKV